MEEQRRVFYARHWQLLYLVTSQFQWRLAPDALLGIIRKGSKSVDLLEDPQVESGALDALEATESLVVLGENPDHLLGGIVSSRHDLTLNGIDQVGPVALQEVEDGLGFRVSSLKLLPLRQHFFIASSGRPLGTGLEDGVD